MIVRAWRSEGAALLGYLAIFGATLAGYAGLGPWVVAVAAIALASVSRAQYADFYERGRELGAQQITDPAMLRSMCNAVIAGATAYGFGWVMRAI